MFNDASGFTAMLIFFDARCKTLLRSSSAGRRPDRGRSYAKGAADARKAVAEDMVRQEVLLRSTGFDRAGQRRDTAAEYELRLADVRADIADQHPDESWPCMRTVVGHHNKHRRAAGPSPAQMMRAMRSEFPSGFEGASAWRAECLRLSRVAFAATADAAVTRHVSPLSRAIVDRNFYNNKVGIIGADPIPSQHCKRLAARRANASGHVDIYGAGTAGLLLRPVLYSG